MSLRKGLTLLLLAAFGLSTVAPALAINVNSGVVYNTIAQDKGSATSGAKQDVVATNILFDLNNAGDIFLATDTTDFTVGSTAAFTGAGLANIAVAGALTAQATTLFVPPTGCKFVKLPGYTDVTAASAADLTVNKTANVIVLNSGNLPTGGSHIFAQVLDAVPSGLTNNATVATFTSGGVVALHAFTAAEAATQNSALVKVTLDKIGLACNADSAALTSGDVNVTVVQPNQGSHVAALPNLTSLSTIKVAEFGSSVNKLHALIAGDTVGTTAGVAEDAQANTLVSNVALQSVTTVNFGPAEATGILSNVGYLDVDAILIRAAETPNSTSTAQVFYQTPFATAKFITAKNLNTDSVELTDADLTNSALFDNETNALITVDLEITSFAGGASSATLAVTNAFVGIDTPDTIANSGASVNGFLGAVAYPVVNAASSTATVLASDVSIISVDPANGGGNHVIDGIALDGSLLTTGLGFVEAGTNGPLQTGVAAADVTPTAISPVAFTSVATDKAFLFPGILVDDTVNVAGGASSFTITDTASKTATVTTFTTSNVTNVNVADKYRNARAVFTNLVPAVATTAGAQYHIVTGDDTIATAHTAKNQQPLAVTDLSEETNYNKPVQVGTADLTRADNVVLASKLVSAGTGKKFTVYILPFTNKFDGVRDVISVRPKGTITLNTAALTEGVKLTAKVYGNNLKDTTTLTLANIVPAGSVTSKITGRILPVNGAQNALLAYPTGTPATGRTTVNPASVTGASTTTDELSDIVGSGKTLDTTVPPLFAGGLAGNTLTGTSARGPRAIVQPKARALAIEESANGDFKAINDLGANARLRITLPAGTDLNLYGIDATAANNYDDILAIFGTAGMTTPTVAANILNVQRVGPTASQAFIDIKVPTVATTTLPIKRALFLVFRPDALVVPKGTTDLNLTLSIVDNGGTASTYTDDTSLATVGTVALAPAASKFLELSFAPQATSAYRASTVSPAAEAFVRSTVESKYGAQNTLFPSTVSSTVRFVNNATPVNTERLWDLQIKEGVADAIPVGTDVDGTPTTLVDAASNGTNGFLNPTDGADAALNDVVLTCVGSELTAFPAAVDNTTATGSANVFFSDSSITAEGLAANAVEELAGIDNAFSVRLAAGTLTGAPRAADTQTTITVTGIRYRGPGATPPSDTDIACWIEADDTNGTAAATEVVIGSSASRAFGGNANPATEYIGVYTDRALTVDQLVKARFGATAPNTATVGGADNTLFGNATNLANGLFNSAFLHTDDYINNALTFKVDDASSSLKLLDNATKLNVSTATLPTVNGAAVTNGDIQATVSAAAGTLQAGTIITVSTSSPSTETVKVPVLADGSFKAVLRSSPTASVTVTQSPTTNRTGANIQLKTVDLTNLDPAFDSTVPTLLTSSLANKGTVVAFFNTPDTTGFEFADVESTAKVNGVAVTKIATGKYAAIVPANAGTYTLSVTVDGTALSTTLNLATVAATGKAVPVLGTVSVKADDSVVVNLSKVGATFPTDVSFEIVYTDGTTAVVANSAVTLKKAGARAKFANPEAAKTIALIQAVSAGGSRAKAL